MFGSNYSAYPEILVDSFGKMKDEYKKTAEKTSKEKIIVTLLRMYVGLFGIPEIGFQIRFLHFNNDISNIHFPKSILDAGSGIGSFVFFLHQKYPRSHIVGGEIDKDKLLFSRRFLKQVKAKKIMFTHLDISRKKMPRNKYDLVVNIDVLEHVKNYKQVLKNFSSVLLPGGYLYIHTPHINQKRIFDFSKNWHHEDHIREGFSLLSLQKEVEKSGLTVRKSYRTFGPFGRFAWEVNHFFLSTSILLAGITYPILYFISLLDLYFTDSKGWGIVILAQKPKL